MTSKKEPEVPTRGILLPVMAAYYFVLLLFYLASVVPEWRVWGFNWWAYLPALYRYGLLLSGVVAGAVIYLARRKTPLSQSPMPPQSSQISFLLFVGFAMAIVGALYQFRATTHFLGDGYTLLANLASDQPIVKGRNLGETLAHQFVYSILTGENSQRALSAYQIVSFAGGLVFAIITVIAARVLFERRGDGIQFGLGLLSGGYMLLFFGYVEHYSLLVPAVALFALVALLVTRGKLNRWFILAPLALAVFLHTLGATLIPAALYLLVSETKLAASWQRLKLWTKSLLTLVVLAGIAAAFYHYYHTDYFFRFAFVPLVENQFTVDGYTMFSFDHLLDTVNLLFLLLPGLLVAITALMFLPENKRRSPRDTVFLLTLLISTLGAAFIFDPKLGMPRDWDLLSLAGVPLVFFCYYLVLKSASKAEVARPAVKLMIVLSVLSLVPRVTAQVVPELSLAHINNYIRLDKTKNRNTLSILVTYYENQGDSLAARQELSRKYNEYPELGLNSHAHELLKQRQNAEAVPYARQAIALSPTYWSAYANLGLCYLRLGRLDSALILMKIADGLNPYNAQVALVMGGVYFRLGELKKAEAEFAMCLALDSTQYEALHGLAYTYMHSGRLDESFEYISKQYYHGQQDSSYFRSAGDSYLRRGTFNLAARAYTYALDRGLDSSYVKQLQRQYPQLIP
jgi:Flp pilus assembly protein TadD